MTLACPVTRVPGGADSLLPHASTLRQLRLNSQQSEAVIPLPNIYGGGILMAFSGLDGKTDFARPFVAGSLLRRRDFGEQGGLDEEQV